MLLQFSVTNHRSIRNTATISMKASRDNSMKDSLTSPDGKKELVPVRRQKQCNPCAAFDAEHGVWCLCEALERSVIAPGTLCVYVCPVRAYPL